MEEFDYEATRKRFPGHWDERGWPAFKSTWRSRNYPQLRVRVLETIDAARARPGSARHEEISSGKHFDGDVRTMVFWDGTLDELRGLFSYEPKDRWNIGKQGIVYGSPGIDRDGRWRDEGPTLDVVFDRAMFGGPDTWQINFEDRTPFFEPVDDWEWLTR